MTVVTEHRDHNLHCNHRETAFDRSKNSKSYTTEARREKTRVQIYCSSQSTRLLRKTPNQKILRHEPGKQKPRTFFECGKTTQNGNYKHRLNARTSSSLQIPRASKIPRIVVPRRVQQQDQATITIRKTRRKKNSNK
jgi:hypothetical protein